MVVGAAVVVTWVSYWSTTDRRAPHRRHLVGDAGRPRRRLDAVPGRQSRRRRSRPASCWPAASALWFVAYVADWAAFRLWVPFEATLPAGTLFLFTSLLGADRGPGLGGGALRGCAARLPAPAPHGPPGRQQPLGRRPAVAGNRSLLSAGAGLGVRRRAGRHGASARRCPGADSPGVLDPTRDPAATTSRVTVSPLVDIQSRLVDQAGRRGVHASQSPERAYWRLTSLERFDGHDLVLERQLREGRRRPPRVGRGRRADREAFDQTFTIAALAAIWLPERLRARRLDDRRRRRSATTRSRPR